MHTLTVNSLLPFKPCQTGWDNFLEVFNNPDPNQPISIVELLDAGISVQDVIWALRGLPETSLLQVKLFAIDCAENILPVFETRFPNDEHPRKVIETAKRFLRGEATLSELREARASAANAVYTAADAYAATNAADAAASASDAAVYAYAAAASATNAVYAYAAYAAAASASVSERAKQAAFLRKHFSE